MSVPDDYPQPGPLGATDPKRWILDTSDDGRVKWTYHKDGPLPKQTDETKYWLGLDLGLPALPDHGGDPLEAARNGFKFYKRLQSPDGHWTGEMSGPQWLTAGFAIAWYVTKTAIPEEWRIELVRYLSNMQRRGGEGDQGWGQHIEGVSTVLGTVLNYVVCRILGVGPDEPMMIRARATLHYHGGAAFAPLPAAFWLCLLNVYSWEGITAMPPEMWLLPKWMPLHPWRWWPYARVSATAMSYLWAHRVAAREDDLVRSLRQELYLEPYESIDWPSCRGKVADIDNFCKFHPFSKLLFGFLGRFENTVPHLLRKAGIDHVYQLVTYEDENTNYQGLCAVNGPMNMIARWDHDGPTSKAFKEHRERRHDFMWMNSKGMLVTSTNGSQLWDLAFITQALAETGLAQEEANWGAVKRALGWLDRSQIRDNPKFYRCAYRHSTKGAWAFSTREQSYPVSDCIAEALKAVLRLQKELPYTDALVTKDRIFDAVDVILSYQNAGGGFGSYELVRGFNIIEWLNIASIVANFMVEHPYPECTSSCLTGLALFQQYYPEYRKLDIDRAIKKGLDFVHREQRLDGSWIGSWGICFTYATMFGMESLALNGETYENSDRARRACAFLLKHQMADGGWGETFESRTTGQYVHHASSQVVNTAWSIRGLLAVKCPDHDAIVRGCRLIMSRQRPNGEWLKESSEGFFNGTNTLGYPNYKFAWTIWVLGKARKELPDVKW